MAPAISSWWIALRKRWPNAWSTWRSRSHVIRPSQRSPSTPIDSAPFSLIPSTTSMWASAKRNQVSLAVVDLFVLSLLQGYGGSYRKRRDEMDDEFNELMNGELFSKFLMAAPSWRWLDYKHLTKLNKILKKSRDLARGLARRRALPSNSWTSSPSCATIQPMPSSTRPSCRHVASWARGRIAPRICWMTLKSCVMCARISPNKIRATKQHYDWWIKKSELRNLELISSPNAVRPWRIIFPFLQFLVGISHSSKLQLSRDSG